MKETAAKISHIQVVSIPVTDQERAKSFYVEKLGFDVRADNPMGPDQRWVEVAPKGAQTGLTLVTWFPTMQPGSVKGLVLNTPDIRTTYEELRARGVGFAGPVQDEFWGKHAEFDDPDGNGWVLLEEPS